MLPPDTLGIHSAVALAQCNASCAICFYRNRCLALHLLRCFDRYPASLLQHLSESSNFLKLLPSFEGAYSCDSVIDTSCQKVALYLTKWHISSKYARWTIGYANLMFSTSSADLRLSHITIRVDNLDLFYIRIHLSRNDLLELWLYTVVSALFSLPITPFGQCVTVFLLAALIQLVDDRFPNPTGTIPATMALHFHALLTLVSTRSMTADTIVIVCIILSVYLTERAIETYMSPYDRRQ